MHSEYTKRAQACKTAQSGPRGTADKTHQKNVALKVIQSALSSVILDEQGSIDMRSTLNILNASLIAVLIVAAVAVSAQGEVGAPYGPSLAMVP